MRTTLGVLLLLVSAFMVLGFFSAGVFSPASFIALLIGAGLPGGFGLAILSGAMGGRGKMEAGRARIRLDTIEAEVLRLAMRMGGRVTVVELVSELAMASEEAQEVLDSMMTRGLAEIQVTESGTLVYDFEDVRRLSEKDQAKGVLDD